MPQSSSQTGNPPREVCLCVFSPSPLPLSSAREPDAAPALISPLQTATLTGSAAPKASDQSLWPPTSTGAKPSQHPSAAHPSVRGYRERGLLSPPPATPPPATCTLLTHTRQIPSFMDDFIYKQDPMCSLSCRRCFCGSEIALEVVPCLPVGLPGG